MDEKRRQRGRPGRKTGFRRKTLEERKENYAGSKTLPASIKEKETHWPEVP
jgi:hypothetical protein